MEPHHLQFLLIGLAVGAAVWAVRRVLDAPVPLGALGGRLCLVAGWAGCHAALLAAGAIGYAIAPPLVLLAAVGLVVYHLRGGAFVPGNSCGSARWADWTDLLGAGALDGRPGLLLGLVAPPSLRDAGRALVRAPLSASAGVVRAFLAALRRRPLWVRLPGLVHVAVLSPTGAGKTTAFCIPHLLTNDDSAVVIDASGEIYASGTAASRRARGHEIRVLDPAGVTGVSSDALNPLAGIRPDQPDFLDLCRAYGDALVVKEGQQSVDPHWQESGAMFIANVIAWVVYITATQNRPDLCNLQTVADILADQNELNAAMEGMKKETALGGMLARLGHKLGHAVDRERGSILSTVARSLAFLDTPAVSAVTNRSTFQAEDLRGKKVTVYLVVKPEQLREKAGLVRLWLTALLRGCVRGGARPGNLAYFLLDEYAALGSRLLCVEDALTQYRKFGVRLFFFLQGTGQLESCFSEGMDKTLLGNCTLVFLGVTDLDTLRYVSDRCGVTTTATVQHSSGGSWSSGSDSQGGFNRSDGGNDGTSASEAQRPLITPDEVGALGDRVAVTFAANLPPLLSCPVRYFEPAFGDAPGRAGGQGIGDGLAGLAFLLVSVAVASVALWAAAQVFRLAV